MVDTDVLLNVSAAFLRSAKALGMPENYPEIACLTWCLRNWRIHEWVDFKYKVKRQNAYWKAGRRTGAQIIPFLRTSKIDALVSYLWRQPVGFDLAIEPWNCTIVLPAMPRRCIFHWPMGNCVILKASELSLQHTRSAELPTAEAGVPTALFPWWPMHQRHSEASDCKSDREHPSVRRVNFTARTRIWKNSLWTLPAQTTKTTALELGGKSASYCCERRPTLPIAAKEAVNRRFLIRAKSVWRQTSNYCWAQAIADEFIDTS